MSIFSESISCYYEPSQFEQIHNAKIGIAGAGGIGSNCASILVRCGFHHFTIADFDVVMPSNLNRQQYNETHVGQPKVDCLKNVLLSINPNLSINTVCNRLDTSNMKSVFELCDIVIEAFDNAECKAALFSTFMHSGKFVVGASGIGGYGSSSDIKVLRISDSVFIVGDGISEVNTTVKPYAPKVIVAAATMADLILHHTIKGHGF